MFVSSGRSIWLIRRPGITSVSITVDQATLRHETRHRPPGSFSYIDIELRGYWLCGPLNSTKKSVGSINILTLFESGKHHSKPPRLLVASSHDDNSQVESRHGLKRTQPLQRAARCRGQGSHHRLHLEDHQATGQLFDATTSTRHAVHARYPYVVLSH